MSSPHERLSGAWNFRDVAETAGVRPGLLFRSSELSKLDAVGREALTDLGIGDVADLRSPREVEHRGPGAVPNGVAVHRLPFPEVTHTHAEDEAAPHEGGWQKMMAEAGEGDAGEAAIRWMTAEYERFPVQIGAQRAVRQVITLLGRGRPVLVHCFAGKDRTGFAVAIALEAAGVGPQPILEDYLRSNGAVSRLREDILSSARSREGVTDEMVSFAESQLTEDVLGVREEYLAASRRVLDETHGSLAGYLRAAGVTDDDLTRLRAQLLG